jgi:hypothetical protein
MSDPGRLISRDDETFARDAPGLIIRILVVVSFGVIVRQAIIGAGSL